MSDKVVYRTAPAIQGLLVTMLLEKNNTGSIKGAMTKNIYSLKIGPNGCIDLWNNIDYQKSLKKKIKFKDTFVIFLAPETMSLWFSGAQSALLHNFAGQSTKPLWFCGGKYEGSVILRGKVCIAP